MMRIWGLSFQDNQLGSVEFHHGNVEFHHGNVTRACPGMTSGCCDSLGYMCNVPYIFVKICEWWPKHWSWLFVILRCAFERFSVGKLWELRPQLRPSWLAWPKQPLKKKFRNLRSCSMRALRNCIERNTFLPSRDEFNLENVTLRAPHFFIKDGVWRCAGYDSSLQKWRHLPPLTFLPAYCKPDGDLFKEYLVCIKDGIVCMNVSKTSQDKFIVLNPLTGKWKELPPLNHRRNPVLMHLVVDALTKSYQVIVAGSSRSGDGRLSRMTEVFDSRTWKWTRTGDLPGPDYALNDYQSGVYKDGYLYCIAFLDQEAGRGILRYNLNKRTWSNNWKYLIPFSTNSTILQLVESWGELYLFSEQVNENNVEHSIDRVEWDTDIERGVSWSLNSVMRSKKMEGRSLEVYPEYTCLPYSKHQLCVFNTIDHSGVVYDVRNHGQSEVLQAPPADQGFSGESFVSLNPLSFTIELSSKSKI
ncbi:hypothetical protein M758_1G332800 [Ceratodon purpureus]|nr:hypothetical protein M758_1G332800 [Ceratodon purpureus]